MNSSTPSPDSPDLAAPDALSAHVSQNIDTVVAFKERELGKLGDAERRLARVSDLIGRPLYLAALLSFVAVWIAGNLVARHAGLVPLDLPPFPWLESMLTLAALLTTTVILVTQNRQAKIENQRAHLDLQVNLLTEQKVTKLIHLIEELRRDLPMVRDRDDPLAASLQQRTDTAQVLSAIADVDADAVGRSPGSGEPASSG